MPLARPAAFEDFLEDLVAMINRGCAVVIMVWWYNTLYTGEYLNVPGDSEWNLKMEVQVLYTLSTTYLASILSARLERQEAILLKDGLCFGCICGKIEKDEDGKTKKDEDGNEIYPVLVKSLKGLSDMIQNALSFVVGCAWSDIITLLFLTLGQAPTPVVLLKNVGITVGLTLIVAYFIVVTGKKYELADAASREATELFLLINGAAFFVGWTWLVVIRDLHAQYSAFLEVTTLSYVTTTLAGPLASMGMTAVEAIDIFGVVTFAIVLTVVFFVASQCILGALKDAQKKKDGETELV